MATSQLNQEMFGMMRLWDDAPGAGPSSPVFGSGASIFSGSGRARSLQP